MQFCSSHINHSRFWQRARRKTKITPSYQWKDFFNCFVANSRAQQDPSGAAGGKAAPWKGQQLLTHPVSSHPAQEKSSKALLPLCLQQIPPGWVPTHWKAPWAHKQREPYPLLNFQISFFHPVLFWDLSHFALPGCTKSLWWFLFDHGRRGLLVSTCITQGAVSTKLEPWHSKSVEKTVPTYILRSKYYITKKRCMKYIFFHQFVLIFNFDNKIIPNQKPKALHACSPRCHKVHLPGEMTTRPMPTALLSFPYTGCSCSVYNRAVPGKPGINLMWSPDRNVRLSSAQLTGPVPNVASMAKQSIIK